MKGGKGSGKGKKGKGKGKGKGGNKGEKGSDNTAHICKQWLIDQTCPYGANCWKAHPPIDGWAKKGGKPKGKGKGSKGKGKGKGKGKDQSREKKLCAHFAAGNCRYGDKCFDLHENGPTLAPLQSNGSKDDAAAKKNPKKQTKGNE